MAFAEITPPSILGMLAASRSPVSVRRASTVWRAVIGGLVVTLLAGVGVAFAVGRQSVRTDEVRSAGGYSVQISGGRVQTIASSTRFDVGSSAPTVTLGSPISEGSAVSVLPVSVEITNPSRRTLVFPGGRIDLQASRDGKRLPVVTVRRGTFKLGPGQTARATYRLPVAGDGLYELTASTRYATSTR